MEMRFIRPLSYNILSLYEIKDVPSSWMSFLLRQAQSSHGTAAGPWLASKAIND